MEDAPEILDSRERAWALDATKSFIVQAPAGSGKTELLIKRYLALLAVVEKPEEILAITFTRKAAGEMERRIIDALGRAGRGERPRKPHEIENYELARAALERDARLGWRLVENPTRLRVQTIDSLASMLSRRMPVLSRTGGSVSPVEDASEFYFEAGRAIAQMAESEQGELPRSALRHFDNSARKLVNRLALMLRKRDQWLRHVPKAGATDFRARVEGVMARMVEKALSRANARLSPHMALFLELGNFAGRNVGAENPIYRLRDLTEPPGTRASELDKWRAVAELLTTKDGALRKNVDKRIGFPAEKKGESAVMKERFKAFLDRLALIEGLQEALGEVRALPAPRYLEEEWQILGDLLGLLPMANAELVRNFSVFGKTDFQGLTSSALLALGADDSPTDLMLSLDLRLRHVLIDEFQDTSITHLELINSLLRGWEPGDGRTLFLVGDPMQSIYLFRDAEVGIFLDAWEKRALAGVALEPLALKCNFRSAPQIVDWVNRVVGNGFPRKSDSFTSAVRYSASIAKRQSSDDGAVKVTLYDSADGAREARDVVEVVRDIKGLFPNDTVAVLAVSRSHLTEIVGAFEKNGVDFRTKDLDTLDMSQPVLDLFSLLKALEHPCDRVAWLSVLRAPWCGLELKDLLSICRGDEKSPVLKLLNDPARVENISPDGRERLGRVRKEMEKALALYRRVPTRALIEGLWCGLGGPLALEGQDSLMDACAFLDMLSKMESAGEPLNAGSIETGLKRLFASHRGATQTPVEVMTMHGAKGLEFDHVILPGLGRAPRVDDKELLVFLENEGELLVAPMEGASENSSGATIYDYIWEHRKKRVENERSRLLYVAATRPKKSLHLFGSTRDKLEPKKGSLLAVIKHGLNEEMRAHPDKCVTERPDEALPAGPPRRRLKSAWEKPGPARPPEGIMAGRMEEVGREDLRPVFDWAGEAVRHVGTTAHAYFVRIAKDGLDKWDLSRVRAERPRMEAMLIALGLNKAEAKWASVECLKTLEAALSLNIGRWALSRHAQGETEYRVSGVIDNEVRRFAIDRTFVDEEGSRWVIDYKTGSHAGGDLEAFLAGEKERYAAQLGAYKKLVEEMDKGRRVRCALYYPALDRLIEY